MKEMVLGGSILILALAALRRVLRGRLDPRLQYALWLLVAARLLIPGALFVSPVSLPAVESVGPTAVVGETVEQVPDWDREMPLPQYPNSEQTAAPSHAPEAELPGQVHGSPQANASNPPHIDWTGLFRAWAPTAWVGGMAVMVLWLLLDNWRFYMGLFARRRRLDLPPEMGAGSLRVYAVQGLESPCLFGLLRPAVYVDGRDQSPERLRHILTHEYTHYRHGDQLWVLVRSACLVVHWFNPLVWWAAVLSRRDCELACDAGVIARLGEDQRLDYGDTLLTVAAGRTRLGGLMRTSTAMSESKRTMKERIALIAQRPRMLKITLVLVLLAAVLAAAVAFGGKEADAAGGDDPTSDDLALETVPEADEVLAEVLALAELEREDFGITWYAREGAPGTNILDEGFAPFLEDALSSVTWERAGEQEEPDAARWIVLWPFVFYEGSDLVCWNPEAYVSGHAADDPPPPEPVWYTAPGAYEAVERAIEDFRAYRQSDPLDGLDTRPLSSQMVTGTSYTHASGLFSLTLPQEWVDVVIYAETEDAVAFYQASSPGAQERTWLMSVVPEPAGWAETYHRQDIFLEEFNYNGSPYVYVLERDHEQEDRPLILQLMSHVQETADSFQLLGSSDFICRLVHDTYPANMPLAVAYLPYLNWSDYRAAYDGDEVFSLLDALWSYVDQHDLTWSQYHDILSNRAWGDRALDGAYAESYESTLWGLYTKQPEQFLSVLESEYITEEERAGVLNWMRGSLIMEGYADPGSQLTDQEVLDLLRASITSVTVRPYSMSFSAPGESQSFLLEGADGTYTAAYTSDDPAVATVDEDGVVTAVGPGQTWVRLHYESGAGEKDFTCWVDCQWEEAAEVSARYSVELTSPGATTRFHVSELPGVGQVTYTSADPGIATVDSDGLVTAVSPGYTTIAVQCEGGGDLSSFTCRVHCGWTVEPDGSITRGLAWGPVYMEVDCSPRGTTAEEPVVLTSPAESTAFELIWIAGEGPAPTATYTVADIGPDGTVMDTGSSSVVSVDENGVITPIGPGEAVVTLHCRQENTDLYDFRCFVRCDWSEDDPYVEADRQMVMGSSRTYGPTVYSTGSPQGLTAALNGDWSLDTLRSAIFAAVEDAVAGTPLAGELIGVEISPAFQCPEGQTDGLVVQVPFTATYGHDIDLPSGRVYPLRSTTPALTAEVTFSGRRVGSPSDEAFAAGQAAYQALAACAQVGPITVPAGESFGTDMLVDAVRANLDSAGLADRYIVESVSAGGFLSQGSPGQTQAVDYTVTFAQADGQSTEISAQVDVTFQ